MIERIIHQMWGMRDAGPMPASFAASQESWKAHHPGWTYILWTPDKVEALVREHYPEIWPLYRDYPEWVQRADAGRYMILHHHGGLYSDLDILCRRPFDDFVDREAMLPETAPVGVSNDLMLSAKGHDFMAGLIAGLAPAYRRWQRPWLPRHLRIMLTTGPLFVTQALRRYSRRDAIAILPPDLYGNGGSDASYVTHMPGNSWAGWDTHLLVFLHRRWRWLAALAALAVIAVAATAR